jgi:hypothetical protein
LIELDEGALERQARASVLRSLLFYSAVLALDLVAIVYIAVIAGPPSGFGWVSLTVTLLLGLLLTQQVYQHARDLRAEPEEVEDNLLRKFQRAELIFVMQNHYLQVGRKIFNVEARDYILVEEGQRVRVRFFPHSLKVVWAVRC